MSSRRSLFVRTLRVLTFAAGVITGIVAGTTASTAYAQSITAGTDHTLPRLCTNRCDQSDQKVVVDASGNAVAAWSEQVTDGSGTLRFQIVTARFNVASRSWGAPRATPRQAPGNLVIGSELGVDGAGNVLLTWTERPNSTTVDYTKLFSRYVASQGSWTRPVAFARSTTRAIIGGNLLVARNGNAVLHPKGFTGDVPTYLFHASTSTWTALAATQRHDYVLDGAIDEVGNVILPYQIRSSESLRLFASRIIFSSRQVTSPFLLDEVIFQKDETGRAVIGGDFVLAKSTRDRFGNEMVLWQKVVNDYINYRSTRTLRSARYQVSKAQWVFKTIEPLNTQQIESISMVTDRSGNVSTTWAQFASSYRRIVFARYSSSTGTWSKPKIISGSTYQARHNVIHVDPAGNLVAVWSQRTDTNTTSGIGEIYRTMAARYLVASGTWTPTITVQDANVKGYAPTVDVDGQGRAVVLWEEDTPATDDGSTMRLRVDRVFPQ